MAKGLKVLTYENETVHKLYQTEIVRYDHQNKVIQLETGGWFSMHTKKCMNLALNPLDYSVIQRQGTWYLVNQNSLETIEFENGMQFKVGA